MKIYIKSFISEEMQIGNVDV